MKIGELARRSGLSAHTIRYYERIGLLPPAGRDGAGRRDYDASILALIEFLGRLKTTGMPIREMLRYVALRNEGEATQSGRRDLLVAHRVRVRAHLADLQACLLVLDAKIDGYAETQTRKNHHEPASERPSRKPALDPARRPARDKARARQAKAL